MKRKISHLGCIVMLSIVLAIACKKGVVGEEGPDGTSGKDGLNSLVKVTTIPVGDPTYPTGGQKIQVGLDINNNKILDLSEIQTTEIIINGRNGANGSNGTNGTNGTDGLKSLAIVKKLAPRVDLPMGGVEIQTGLDKDKDGQLDPDEIESDEIIANGSKGDKGDAGTNGTNGIDGLKSLVNITNEPAGVNCSTGGLRISSGLDLSKNDTLETAEETSVKYVCNGIKGDKGDAGTNGHNSIVETTTVGASAECPTGGIKIVVAIDNNDNKVIDGPDDILSTKYVCNGIQGPKGDKGDPGTANVIYSNWINNDTAAWKQPGTGFRVTPPAYNAIWPIYVPKLSTDIIDKGIILVYFRDSSTATKKLLPFSIPISYRSSISHYFETSKDTITMRLSVLGESISYFPINLFTISQNPKLQYQYFLIPGGVPAGARKISIDYTKYSYEQVCKMLGVQPKE